ncbi:MAG: SDR family oxidoreductase [Deltaproteobacteria bacterium]|nr:SDR family oxidoreductase [Deltaproteobacteria bacterium]
MEKKRDPFKLEDRIALVTGASGAIGREIALALAEAGAHVVASGRNEGRLGRTVDEVKARGREALALTADLSLLEGVEALAEQALAWKGRVDILVNNAAHNFMQPASRFSPEEFDQVLGTNLRGPFFLTQALGRAMGEQGGGCVIFITSQLGQTAMHMTAVYGATKAALMQLTRSLALEWAPQGIRVNSVSPGPWAEGMLEPLFQDGKTLGRLSRLTPRGRLGRTGDLGGAVVFMASDAAGHITGQDLVVDGGFSIARIL